MSRVFDQHINLAQATVLLPPTDPLNGSVFTVNAGEGSNFPSPPFNCVIAPAQTLPSYSNAEVVRVLHIAGDTLTVHRVQENSGNISIKAGYSVYLAITAKSFIDIEAAITSSLNLSNSLSINNGVLIDNTGTFGGFTGDVRLKAGEGLQFYNSDTGLWHTRLITGTVPHGAWGVGDSSSTVAATGLSGNVRYKVGEGLQFYNNSTSAWHTWYCIGPTLAHEAWGVADTSVLYDTNNEETVFVRYSPAVGLQLYNRDNGTWYHVSCVHSSPVDLWTPVSSNLTASGIGGLFGVSGSNVRFKAGKGFQYYNSTTGRWHTKLCIGNPPKDAWDAGDV